ncbi:MAG: HIT domain-containing protein [Nakamurella sp.]
MTPQGDPDGAGARESAGLQDGVGEPDGFARLWTPHRLAYVSSGENQQPGCPFCRIPTLGDRQGLIVARGEHNFVVLNLYPYNPGHLMVVPYRHIADYSDLTDAELTEFSALTRRALTVIRSVSNPHGFNIGINAGAAAGAGIAPHLHQHVVPRWSGDANFMPVVAQTKVLPELLPTTRDRLAEAW